MWYDIVIHLRLQALLHPAIQPLGIHLRHVTLNNGKTAVPMSQSSSKLNQPHRSQQHRHPDLIPCLCVKLCRRNDDKNDWIQSVRESRCNALQNHAERSLCWVWGLPAGLGRRVLLVLSSRPIFHARRTHLRNA